MKKRDIIIDLTAFLDVILVMMFLVLTINAGEMFDYRSRVGELEAQYFIIEQELDETEQALAQTNERLLALSDWDSQKIALTSQLDILNNWISVVEEAIYFISIDMEIGLNERVIVVDEFIEIEVTWIDGRNAIYNEDRILDELYAALSSIINPIADSYPVMIMFNYRGVARQEHALISRGIRLFIENAEDFSIYYSSYAR